MAILSNGKFYGFLCSVKATGRKLSNGVKEYVEDFVSGFAGHGWKLWEYIKGKWKLEIDSLVVRETMVVFELLIQKIRAVKGALGITQACGRIKTATLDESGQNWLVTIEDEMSFVAHDFIRCQDWTNGTLKGYWVEISEIRKIDGVDTIVIPVSDFTGGIGYTDGMEAVDPALSGMTTPAIGDEIVQFGNSKDVNRQSAIYLHADEGGQPAIDILFGINSKSFAGCTKIRMGGELPGTDGLKGFYCENGMIKGTDSTGHVVYCIYPDGTAEFGDGSAKFATDKSGYIAGGAISWHWDASKNKYVCSMKGVVLTWDNLDEETKENLKGEPGKDGQDGTNGTDGKDGTSLIFMGEFSSAPADPQNGYWYRNTTDKKCYVYQDGAWYVMTEDGKNGLDGEGSISADLDDEMQSVACSLDGTVVSGLPVTTTFSMFYGTTELSLDSLSVGSITGVTATADRSTGIVKVTAITAAVADVIRIPITGRVTYKGAQYERTLHLSINKVKPGTPGEDANLLPWVEDWNNNKTEIGGEYLISPKIFSGTKDSNGKLTGVALGRDCVTVDGEKKTGIFALDQDDLMLELDPLNKRYVFRGTNIIGSPNGQRVVISPDSKDIKIFDDSNKNVLRIDGASKDSLNDLFSQNIPTINVKNIPASVPSQEREYMVDITDPIYVTGNVALDGRFFGGYTSSSPNTIFVEIILKAYSDSSLQNIIYADYIYSKVVSYKTEHTFNDEKFTGFLVSGYNVLSLRLAMSYQYSHSFSINNMSITPVVNEYLSSLFANGISLGTSSKNLFSVMNRRVNGINSIQAILSDGTSGLRLDSNGLQSLRNGRWGMVPSIICYGRAYSTPSNAYIRRCKSYNGDIPTITRMSSTLGYLRMNIPSSWTADGFSESTVQIMLTGYGQSANGSASNMSEFLIKATVLSVTSSYVYIGLSDDDTGNDGEFYFEMKWL